MNLRARVEARAQTLVRARARSRSRSRSRSARLLLTAVAVTVVGLVVLGLVAGLAGPDDPGSGDGPARLGAAEIPTEPNGSLGPLAAPGAAEPGAAGPEAATDGPTVDGPTVDGPTVDGPTVDGSAADGSAADRPAAGGSGDTGVGQVPAGTAPWRPAPAGSPAGDTSAGGAGRTAAGGTTQLGPAAGGDPAMGTTGGRESEIPGPGAAPAPSAGAGESTPRPAVEQAITPSTGASTSPAPASGGDDGAGLLWSDEFGGAAGAAPDPAIWITQTGFGWGDQEMQCYTRDPRNLATDGRGNLVITTLLEPSCDGARFSSGRIETLGKRTMRYGYLETRAVLPTGRGAFPAVWLLGSNMPEVDWPASGELDVVEAVSTAPTTVHTNVHGVDAAGAHWQAGWGNGGMYDAGIDLAAGFHRYGLEWTPSALWFYFDGRLIRTVTREQVPVWLWDREHYAILNVAVNSQGASATAADYPQRMVVDYLRVYAAKP